MNFTLLQISQREILFPQPNHNNNIANYAAFEGGKKLTKYMPLKVDRWIVTAT
jgi:hypothetical protein